MMRRILVNYAVNQNHLKRDDADEYMPIKEALYVAAEDREL